MSSNIIDYYCFERNSSCPVCEKNITSECYETHGLEFYNHLLKKDICFHCSVCKELCRPYDYIFHYHGMKNGCFWCRKSLNPVDVKHLIECYREFIRNAIPPKIPNSDFKECCPICDKSLKLFSNIKLKCNHNFHRACISDWVLNYYIKKCPICFKRIDSHQYLSLKTFGYTIEKMQLDVFFSESGYFSNIPTEYTNFYFNTINEFYSNWDIYPHRLSRESIIYPKWTYDRFLKRFTHILQNEPVNFKDFEDKIKWHFKKIMLKRINV